MPNRAGREERMTITTEEAERLAERHAYESRAWASDGGNHDLSRFHNQSSVALNSLSFERDALQAENARLRETLLLARIAVSHASELSDRILYTQDLAKIDAALGETQ